MNGNVSIDRLPLLLCLQVLYRRRPLLGNVARLQNHQNAEPNVYSCGIRGISGVVLEAITFEAPRGIFLLPRPRRLLFE